MRGSVWDVLSHMPLSTHLVDFIDRVRLLHPTTHADEYKEAYDMLVRHQSCPFNGARPSTLSFSEWLDWSQLGVLTMHERQVRGRGGKVEEIHEIEFPQRHLSLILYYAAYAYNVSVYPVIDTYHTEVNKTLIALWDVSKGRTRSLALEIATSPSASSKPHNLFHRLYGAKQKDPPPVESRLYVPAQFFFKVIHSLSSWWWWW
jgi:hypothetical protein